MNHNSMIKFHPLSIEFDDVFSFRRWVSCFQVFADDGF